MALDLTALSDHDREQLLVEAMRRDLPLAVALLSRKAQETDGDWIEDPSSAIGQQLIRLHASDALRPLASKHFCNGKTLTFLNCCGGNVGKPPQRLNLLQLQIEMQAGPLAYANC